MRIKAPVTVLCLTLCYATCYATCSAAVGLGGQRGQRGAGPAGRGGAAAQRGAAAPTNFPAQQRPAGDPAVVATGEALYGIHCRACHGPDLRGGEQGGPNLLRSEITLNDQAGELIMPIVLNGRQTPGLGTMPPIALSRNDVGAIAEYIHSVLARAQRQGGPPAGPPAQLNVLVGDAAAGKAYFDAKCASCHSVTGDLAGIGQRQTNPMQLQNFWIAGGNAGNRPVTATITLAGGQKISGRLNRIDDFMVQVTLDDESVRTFRRDGDTPRVEVNDTRDAHRNLLPQYTDRDIHNVTAYLVTVK
ncbi:MAG TPA: c-type cytochrome [Terriglobia bacterium]|nr:c-type cytochrome [Terriglobia bacterium]